MVGTYNDGTYNAGIYAYAAVGIAGVAHGRLVPTALVEVRLVPLGGDKLADIVAVGQLVRVYAYFRDIAGALSDPTAVTSKSQNPAGTETTKAYGTDAEVIKVGTGVYYRDLDVDRAGTWYWRWNGGGVLQAADEGHFTASTTEF